MKTNNREASLPSGKDGADPSIDLRDLIMPQEETNTFEGCEYLDDNIRMEDQPYAEVKGGQ